MATRTASLWCAQHLALTCCLDARTLRSPPLRMGMRMMRMRMMRMTGRRRRRRGRRRGRRRKVRRKVRRNARRRVRRRRRVATMIVSMAMTTRVWRAMVQAENPSPRYQRLLPDNLFEGQLHAHHCIHPTRPIHPSIHAHTYPCIHHCIHPTRPIHPSTHSSTHIHLSAYVCIHATTDTSVQATTFLPPSKCSRFAIPRRRSPRRKP